MATVAEPDARHAEASLPRRQVLADGVHETLMALLMDGSLPPRSPVRIDTVARNLRVSPTPVREALARIEATGLVVREPLRGYRVAPRMTPEDVDELMQARLVIEPHNAASACLRKSPALVSDLGEALRQMREAPTGPTYREFRPFLEADARFHEVISAHSGNRFLAEAVARLGAHVQRFRLFGNQGVTDAAVSIAEHRAVLDAISGGSADAAREAMAAHLGNVRQRAMTAAADLAGPAAAAGGRPASRRSGR